MSGDQPGADNTMADATLIELDKISDISKVEALHEKLEALLGSAASVDIDAARVERIDTATLQLLTVFFCALDRHHLQARILSPSRTFADTARLLGLADALNLSN